MTTWSLNGYEVAVRIVRSSKTILVEGPTDKRVLSRMLLERASTIGRAIHCVIDEASIVGDQVLAGKGAKDRVEAIASVVGEGSGRFNWIVDREWEGVDIEQPHVFSAPPDRPWGLRTMGHSIENYWFRHDALSSYLKMFFGDVLPHDFFADLGTRFDLMLRAAAAYSFATKRLGVVTRCGDAIRARDLVWEENEYRVAPSLSVHVANRGVQIDLTAEVNAELEKADLRNASRNVLQWLCHGHLGEEMIRACAAALAIQHGCNQPTAEQIERGKKGDKLAYDSDFIAALDAAAVQPLQALVDWAAA